MKACIFDMDGTLLDSMLHWRRVSEEFLRDHGLRVPDDMVEELPRMSTKRTSVEFARRFPQLNMTAGQILADYMRRMTEHYQRHTEEKPGAGAYLAFLRERGIPYCVATTTDEGTATAALDRHGMLEGAAFVLCTQDLGLSKADPACFEAVAARLGLPSGDCAVFEDALYAVEGAAKAGCIVYGVEDASAAHHRDMIAPLCRAMVRDYAELMG